MVRAEEKSDVNVSIEATAVVAAIMIITYCFLEYLNARRRPQL